MTEKHFITRRMQQNELALAVDWAGKEGWNPGLHDAETCVCLDPDGFFMGCLDGDPVAVIVAVKYDDTFGFIGNYIVRPDVRGLGYGSRLWHCALDYLDGVTTGIEGDPARQAKYEKAGFRLAYRHRRYQVAGKPAKVDRSDILPLKEIPIGLYEQYEQDFFPACRTAFMRAMLSQPGACALGFVSEGKLSGYGVIRQSLEGYRIGPLYSDAIEIAERLFLALWASTGSDEKVAMDIPEVNLSAMDVAKRQGMSVEFETLRMYRGEVPNLPLQRIYGITSLEMG